MKGCLLLQGKTSKFLKPEKVDAAPFAAFAPQIKVTTFVVPNLIKASFGTYLNKIGEIGQFTSYSSASVIELTYQGRLMVGIFSGASAAQFLMDVDGLPPNAVWGLVHALEAGKYVPATFTTFYQNIPTGNHKVNI